MSTVTFQNSFIQLTGLVNDPLAVRDYQTLWRRLLHQGISIAAFKTPSDSDAKPTLAGVLSVKTTEDGARAKSILEVLPKISGIPNVCPNFCLFYLTFFRGRICLIPIFLTTLV